MLRLGVLVVLLAAASAFPTDKIFYRCVPFLTDHSVFFKESTFLCDSFDGARYLVAKDSYDNIVHEGRVLSDVPVAVQRTLPFLGGLGGGGAGSAAQSSAGSIGGSIGGGVLPFSLGGSVSGAQSSAASGAGGGGLGLLG